MDLDKLLENAYYDPSQPASYSSADKLWRFVKNQDGFENVKKKQIRQWLQLQDTHTVHKPVRRKFKRNPVIVPSIDYQWDIDLMDTSNLKRYNKGITFLLVAIDILSRYLWVRPLKNKTAGEVAKALKYIFKKNRKPKIIRSDSGKEFTNSKVQKLLKDMGIKFFTSNNEVKANYVERVIQTLRNKLFKYMNKKQSYKYVNILQDLVKGYNDNYHRSIQTSPSQVNKDNEDKIWRLLYGSKLLKREKYVFKPGDKVRVAYTRGTFDRGYEQQYSDEIFTVVKLIPRNPPVYKIVDFNGNSIKGTFYKEELQRVYKDENSEYKTEKILKKRKRNGKTQYLVRWVGYPSEFDSYVNEEDVRNLS